MDFNHMASARVLLPLLVLGTASAADVSNSSGGPILPAIVPCEQMDCKIGMHCELGRVICAPGSSCGEEGCSNVTASKCSARPTKCAPGWFLDFLTLILIGEYEVEAEGSGGGSTPANPPTGNR